MDYFLLQARQSGVDLIFDGITTTPSLLNRVTLYADFHKLNQVVRNLVSNALKFTPKGGKVTVCATVIEDYDNMPNMTNDTEQLQCENKYVRIDVCDTGYGIPKVTSDTTNAMAMT